MKKKILVLLGLIIFVLALFVSQGFAQVDQPVESKNIVCGNNVCEKSTLYLKPGETGNLSVAGKNYSFKLNKLESLPQTGISINEKGVEEKYTYFTFKIYLSVNGQASKEYTEQELRDELGVKPSLYTNEDQNANQAVISFTESDVCMVPDCGFRLEYKISKGWNLTPSYFFLSKDYKSLSGTCNAQDFKVFYGFNPIKRDYVRLFLKLDSSTPLEDAEREYSMLSQKFNVLAGSPFNSVWVYAKKECILTSELPSPYESFLTIFNASIEANNQKHNFPSGWNFWLGDQANKGKPLDEIKGNCEIEKAFKFNALNQQWEKTLTVPGFEEALLFKTKNSCMLKEKETTPPSLPA